MDDDRIVEVIAEFICGEVGVAYPSGLIDVQAREMLDYLRAHGAEVVSGEAAQEIGRLRAALCHVWACPAEPFACEDAAHAEATSLVSAVDRETNAPTEQDLARTTPEGLH